MKKKYIIVVGNEKGGAGKTTTAMHLIASLLDLGFNIASIDTDVRQKSLSRYLENRHLTKITKKLDIKMPIHYIAKESFSNETDLSNKEEKEYFEQIIDNIEEKTDFIIIDTPGRNSFLTCLVHSYADTIITPINDSFVDLDVLAKINGENLQVERPSIYSQLVWEQKMQRAKRDGGSIDWIIVRNRLSNLDAKNKRNISEVLEKLAKRVGFKIVAGFSERVIFRELFLQGLTLLDIQEIGQNLSMSHIAARQELRSLLNSLGISTLKEKPVSDLESVPELISEIE